MFLQSSFPPFPASSARGESVSVISCVVSCVVSWQRKSSPTVVRLVACIIRSLTSLHHLRRRTPRNLAGVGSRVLSPRFTNPLSNVTLRKTNKNGKFTKREKFSKSEVGPKKKLARTGALAMPSVISCLCWVKKGAAKENPDQVG